MVESFSVWRISRNQFEPVWAEIAENYTSGKLEVLIPLIPQGHMSSRCHMTDKSHTHLFWKGLIWFEVWLKHWKGLKLGENLRFEITTNRELKVEITNWLINTNWWFWIWDWCFRLVDLGLRIGDWGKINWGKTPIPNSKSPIGNLSPIGDFHF